LTFSRKHSLQDEIEPREHDAPQPAPWSLDHDSFDTGYTSRRQQLNDKNLSSHTNIVSAEDAGHQAAVLLETILKHHTGLRECLSGRQDSILKRWKGWKEPRRRSAILTACPDMAPKGFVQDVLLGKITNASTCRAQFLLFPMSIDKLSENYLALLGFAHWGATRQQVLKIVWHLIGSS